ncbi:MAG TPA: glycoside hydrolase family 3 N-terminal domain-containing protein [Terriglobales bacterium]|nr:glycoside hydrolase family 3 N-terminal domain-containing protein [Terriglobales bacterium]
MPKKFLVWVLMAAMVCAPAMARDKFLAAGPVRLDSDGAKWAEKTLKKMSLEQKIGQMIMIWCRVKFTNVDSPEYIALRDTMRKYHIGSFGTTVPLDGPFLQKSEPYEAAMLINQLQRDSELPLIFAADFEQGVSMRLNGTTVFPAAMAFGADGRRADAEAFGRITGQEARAIGVEWNFFPIADINSNPVNPIINTRSFGEDPQEVGDFVAAYIEGAHQSGLLTTAKHFPGHGDTATDSHLGLARVDLPLEHLEHSELPPFQKAIDAGVDAVMVAHLTVPALDPDANVVSSTSHKIVTDLLKDKMGFKGLVVTDALDMNGLMRLYAGGGQNPSGAAAVAAVKAGNDMILIPGDLDGAYNGLLNAARSGEIPRQQIDASVLKILKAKASVGLNKARLVDVAKVDDLVARPDNVGEGQAVADAAVTLVRDSGQALPLKRSAGTSGGRNPYLQMEEHANRVVAVVFSDNVRLMSGRVFERELKARIPEAHVFFVDPSIAAGMTEQVMQAVSQAQTVVLPVYAVPVSGKAVKTASGLQNTVGLQEATGALLHRILQTAGAHAVVLAMGNPYIGADYPEMQNYVCTFSNTSVSELSAVRALFGEIAIRGRLPVTIPEVAQRGAGLDRPAQTLQGGVKSHGKVSGNP